MKNLLFDFGRTIVEHPADGAGLTIIKETGVMNEADAILIRDAVFSVSKYLNYLDEGSMTRDEYKRLLLEELPNHLHEYILKTVDYHISKLPVIFGMEELLIKLKGDGYKLYITSNLDELHANQMYETKIAKYFDDMIFSSRIKVRKPYKGFFEAALTKFGLEAKDCIFIDDLEENVEGARACGIQGYVFLGDAAALEKYIYEQK